MFRRLRKGDAGGDPLWRFTVMTPRPVTVSADLQVSLVIPGATALPVRASLAYDAHDPYAVRVAFHTGSGEAVQWTFSRQLLTDGVTSPTGYGDVRTWPSQSDQGPVVCLSLSSPSGNALFELPVPELVEFLTMTYAAVPTGSESDHVDVEAELAELLLIDPDL
jgi:hypothetical protein